MECDLLYTWGKALPDWEGDTTDLVSQRAKLYAFERFDDGGTRY
jgi:hypothetical protein